MELFSEKASNPKSNAQRNLEGRTHYVDDNTLRWHKSRVLASRVHDNGLLFSIVTRDALDMNNTRRGYRFVIFDIFGTVLGRPDLEHSFPTRKACDKAKYAALDAIDAHAHTVKAIETARQNYARELQWIGEQVAKLAPVSQAKA